jgi:thiazole synthase ThiGH ThiG subunit
MLAGGHTYNDVADATGLSFSALSGLRARHEVALDVRRKQLATDGFEMAEGARFLVRKKMEMMADDDDQLKKANLKDLGIAAVMFQERALQALEGNKVIVEHRGNKPSLEDAMKAIEEARRIVNADVIDVTEVSE